MSRSHLPLWVEVVASLGPPVFAGTLVACLLSGRLQAFHLALMAAGVALIALGHWGRHHRRGG